MSRCQMPAHICESNQEARDLLCELCCGNYRIFQEALLAFTGVEAGCRPHVNPGVMLVHLSAVQAGSSSPLLLKRCDADCCLYGSSSSCKWWQRHNPGSQCRQDADATTVKGMILAVKLGAAKWDAV